MVEIFHNAAQDRVSFINMCTAGSDGEMSLGLRCIQLGDAERTGDGHPTKQVIQLRWERGVAQASSLGWTGELVARDTGTADKEFCPVVLWPSVPLRVLEAPRIDLESLESKLRSKTSDQVI